jgi:hypothetical protein
VYSFGLAHEPVKRRQKANRCIMGDPSFFGQCKTCTPAGTQCDFQAAFKRLHVIGNGRLVKVQHRLGGCETPMSDNSIKDA